MPSRSRKKQKSKIEKIKIRIIEKLQNRKVAKIENFNILFLFNTLLL